MNEENVVYICLLLIGFICGILWGYVIWGNKAHIDELKQKIEGKK